MANVSGPFSQTTFCGASVTSFVSAVGWNEQSSVVTVQLVEDKGQRFSRPGMGTPQKFVFEGFEFEGIVQQWVEKKAIDGKPTYEVMLTDPREILAGAQVILSSYRGDVGVIKNLLNAFGYWEDQLGFGGALTNESGMVWNAPFEILGLDATTGGITIKPTGSIGIMPAIHILTKGGNKFGGPLSFAGHQYRVDLSALPVPPAYYRMGGVSSSIMDLVSGICDDGGCDYICILKDGVISFRTVSRSMQPNPGAIANFINSRADVISNSIGIELANNVTNAILLGGDYTQLVQEYNPGGDQTIWPFWGFDIDGSVIVGTGNPETGNHQFHLNCSAIADVMGTVQYPCDIPELRCALIDYDSWSAYVLVSNQAKAKIINLVSAVDSASDLATLFPDTLFGTDMISDTQQSVNEFGAMNESDYWVERAQRVYEFVRQAATDYFGKKFLVKIPFNIYWKMEPETTHVISSDEPTDAAYYPEQGLPLGIGFVDENTFLSQDGRFECFVGYSSAANNADLQTLPPDSTVINNATVYMKASVDTDIGIVYPAGSPLPYVVITVDSPVYEKAKDPLGNVGDIATILNISPQAMQYAISIRHGSFPMKIHPPPYRPDGVCVPMKSNRDSYGPWFTSGGIDGKVSFERDEGLVPWTYGSIDIMNLAAQAKLTNAATGMQYQESGSLEIAGSPEHSLGDELVAGGPQLTGIDVSISSGGVTTSYRMQTYTPRFGRFTKDNADRLRRLGTAAMEMRRAVRNLYQREASVQRIVMSAEIGFMANTSRAVMQASPHKCIVSTMTYDKQVGYRTQVSFCTAQEAIANMRGDNPLIWPYTSMMTLEGLLRPFSTNSQRADDDPFNDMPHYEDPKEDYPIDVDNLDPFSDGIDVDYLTWGDTYPGRVHTLKKKADMTNCRPIGLRGPMVVIGWGYTYTGKPIPNTSDKGDDGPPETQWGRSFIENYKSRPETWKAGPIGLYWDNWRKMWTIPTFLFGTIGSDGKLEVSFNGNPTGDKLGLSNWLGGTLQEGTKVCAGYCQQENTWYVISASCPT